MCMYVHKVLCGSKGKRSRTHYSKQSHWINQWLPYDWMVFHFSQMKYGLLVACCRSCHGSSVCVIRGLESHVSPQGDLIVNELDCPALMLTHTVFTVQPSSIEKSVSIIHECGNTCKFTSKQSPRVIEREQLYLSSRLEFVHDFGVNYAYYLNVYCINSKS